MSSNAQALELVGDVESPVTRDPAGQALAAIAGPTASRPDGNDVRRSPRRPEAVELAAELGADRLRGQSRRLHRAAPVLAANGDDDGRLGPPRRQRVRRRRGHHASARRTAARRGAPAGGRRRAREKTSSSRRSGGAPRRSARTAASARRSASTAVRCSPCEPKPRRSRSAARICRVPEMGADARSSRARDRGRAAPRARRPSGRARARRRASAPASPSSAACSREARRQRGDELRAGGVELGPERRDLLRPRLERVACGGARAHAAERLVPLRKRPTVLAREPCPGRGRPAEHAVEVCPPHRWAALDDRQPVGDERERREPRAELLRRWRAAAPFSAQLLALAGRDRHLGLDRRAGFRPSRRTRAACSPKRTRRGSARVRGEKPCTRRGAPPAGSSSRPRSGRPPARARARGQGRERRTSGSSEAWPGRRSAGQPDRHDQVEEVVALAVEKPRPQRADQLQPRGVVGHRLEPVAEELRVEADLERLAASRRSAATRAPRRRPASAPTPSARPPRSEGEAATSAAPAARCAGRRRGTPRAAACTSASNCSGRSCL